MTEYEDLETLAKNCEMDAHWLHWYTEQWNRTHQSPHDNQRYFDSMQACLRGVEDSTAEYKKLLNKLISKSYT